jgi:uncharacterized MAPEG superfamily protein
VFFWSRLVYLVVYYAGISILRTVVWGVSIVGLAMMVVVMPRHRDHRYRQHHA